MLSHFCKIILALFSIAALLGLSNSAESLHSLFQTFDLNGNGKIERSEFTENMIKNVFNKLDDNDSDIITGLEWSLIENVDDQDRHEELFKAIDIDRDQMIRYKEFFHYAEKHSNVAETFISLDKNGDGILNPDEIATRPPFSLVTIHY